MKALAAAFVVLLVLALLGWYTLFRDGDEFGVDVNPDVVKEDVSDAAGALKKGAEKVEEEAEKVSIDVKVDRD